MNGATDQDDGPTGDGMTGDCATAGPPIAVETRIAAATNRRTNTALSAGVAATYIRRMSDNDSLLYERLPFFAPLQHGRLGPAAHCRLVQLLPSSFAARDPGSTRPGVDPLNSPMKFLLHLRTLFRPAHPPARWLSDRRLAFDLRTPTRGITTLRPTSSARSDFVDTVPGIAPGKSRR